MNQGTHFGAPKLYHTKAARVKEIYKLLQLRCFCATCILLFAVSICERNTYMYTFVFKFLFFLNVSTSVLTLRSAPVGKQVQK